MRRQKTILFLFILSVLTASFLWSVPGQEEKGGEKITRDDKGRIVSVVNSSDNTEKKIKYHENGKKRSEAIFKNGKLEGAFVSWHANGQKQTEGLYKDGKRHGVWQTWWENGKLWGKGEFVNGAPSGPQAFWWESGKKKQEMNLKNGKLDGSYKEYYPNGNPTVSFKLEMGTRNGMATWWHENGKKSKEGLYKNNKREGKWFSWTPEGVVYTERTYKDGDPVEENKELLKKAQATSKPIYEMVMPKGFSPDKADKADKKASAKKYPLILFLHGGGASIAMTKSPMGWKGRQLGEQEFFSAFLQSSQVYEWESYRWDDLEKGRKEISGMYAEIVKKYPVDTSRVYVVGMSQGGKMLINLVMHDAVPVKGFLACCPNKPDDLTVDQAKAAAARGIRGTILAGEHDTKWLPHAKEITAMFKEAGLEHRFMILPMGHRVPGRSTQQILDAITHILNKESKKEQPVKDSK